MKAITLSLLSFLFGIVATMLVRGTYDWKPTLVLGAILLSVWVMLILQVAIFFIQVHNSTKINQLCTKSKH